MILEEELCLILVTSLDANQKAEHYGQVRFVEIISVLLQPLRGLLGLREKLSIALVIAAA